MKPRPDSYEAALSDEQREELHALLLSQDLSLAAVRLLAPAWVGGSRDGLKPSIATLSEIGARLRREQMLLNVEAKAKLMEAVRKQAKTHAVELTSGQTLEEMIDMACDLVGQEVLQKTMEDVDPKNRTAALRALLKRADQKLNRELFTLDREKFEFDAAQACLKHLPYLKQISSHKGMTEAEKIQAIRERLWGKPPSQ